MFDYTGKVVAITGASSGLGKQMAEGYAQCGADLVLLARRADRLEASAKEWEAKYGVQVLPVACDVTSTEAINNALNAIDAKFGHVEVIVNDAGGERGTGTALVDYKKEDWEFTLNLDLTSVFEVTKIFAGYMNSIPPSIRVFSNESTLCLSDQNIGVSALASFLLKNTQG